MKKLLMLCILAALLIGGANTFGPTLAEEGIYQALSQKMALNRDDVHVMARPGGNVFLGKLDEVQIHSNQFQVGSIPFEQFDCVLEGVTFSPVDTLLEQRLAISGAQSGTMTASVRRDALQQFLVQKIDGISDADVTFSGNSVVVSGTIPVGGLFSARAVVKGAFGMNGTKLMFIPQHVTVEGLGMTYDGLKLGDAEVYDFKAFPLGIQPDKVTMDGDLLTIHGQVRNV